ncbi:DEAD/DEAH box helicase [Candidatus Daviesbacteria bacterium]|nr:DEAD/DEAH box helicase [Candidatus Daviesbacteria bacterium]
MVIFSNIDFDLENSFWINQKKFNLIKKISICKECNSDCDCIKGQSCECKHNCMCPNILVEDSLDDDFILDKTFFQNEFLEKAVISTPTDKEGKFDATKVPIGASVWITIGNPESPLHGRHVMITKRPDGLMAITGGAGVDKETAARRHLILTGTPRKTKRDDELEEIVDEAKKYNEPLLVERKQLQREAIEEIKVAADDMKKAFGLSDMNKKTMLEKKDEIQNYVESILGEDEKGQAKRLTDTVARHLVLAERKISEHIQRDREVIFAKIGKRITRFSEEELPKALEEVNDSIQNYSSSVINLPDLSDLKGLSSLQQELVIANYFDKQANDFFSAEKIDHIEKKDVPQITLGETVKPLEIRSSEELHNAIDKVKHYWETRSKAEEITSSLKRIPLKPSSSSTIAELRNDLKGMNIEMDFDEIVDKAEQNLVRWQTNNSALAFYDAVGDYWNDDTSLSEQLTNKDKFDSTMQFHISSGAATALASLSKEYLGTRLDTLRLINTANLESAVAITALEIRQKFAKDPKAYDEALVKIKDFNAKNQIDTEKIALDRHATLKTQYDEIQKQKSTGELLDKIRISNLELENIVEQKRNLGSALGSLQASATFYDYLTKFKTAKDDIVQINVGNNINDANDMVDRLRLRKGYEVDTSDPDNIRIKAGLSSFEKFVNEEKDIKSKADQYDKLKTSMDGIIEDEDGRLVADKYDVPGWKNEYIDEQGNTQQYKWRVEQRNDINWLLDATRSTQENPLGEGGGLVTRVVGAGKTNTALGFFANKINDNKDYKGLVVVPKGRAQQWVDEAKKFTDLNIELIPDGTAKDRVDEILSKSKPGTIYVTGHREAARSHLTLEALQTSKEFSDKKFHGLVIDEPQELQARGQSGNIGELGKRLMHLPMQHRVGLTATPARRNPLEVYDLIKWTSGAKDIGDKASFKRVFSGFGSGTNAQDTAIRKLYFNTIQPYISGDRITTPNFKVKQESINFNRTSTQIAKQKEIESQSAAYIERRKNEIVREVQANPAHPLRRLINWQFSAPRKAVEMARTEVENMHRDNMDDGDYRNNSKLMKFKESFEKDPKKKRVLFIDSRTQRVSLMEMFKDIGLKPNQIKNIAATTTAITGEEMANRVKDFKTNKDIPIILIDTKSSSGYNLQAGDVLDVLGTPQDASVYLQAQGRLARMPRKGDVEIATYKYNDNPIEQAKWNQLEAQLKILRASSPGLFPTQNE